MNNLTTTCLAHVQSFVHLVLRWFPEIETHAQQADDQGIGPTPAIRFESRAVKKKYDSTESTVLRSRFFVHPKEQKDFDLIKALQFKVLIKSVYLLDLQDPCKHELLYARHLASRRCMHTTTRLASGRLTYADHSP